MAPEQTPNEVPAAGPTTRLLERRDVLAGLLVYPLGDSAAALLTGHFMVSRLLGMGVLGATLYAGEIPLCFRWIERRVPAALPLGRRAVARTGLALLYFGPLWIARHLLFIHAFSGEWSSLSWALVKIGWLSWLYSLPLTVLGNFLVQVILPFRFRFFANAVFSGSLATYYALSTSIFR